jgi:CheY-like chemotaxis protein
MVHGIIHELGGHLLLDSRPGEGASLRILLPPLSIGEAGATTDAIVDVRPDRHRIAGRVLLVDDEPTVGEFMQDLLEDWGLTVSVYNSSVDACMQFSDDPDLYDLVILDQTMPRMSGMEVAQQLLGLRPDLPVILYTGYNDEITEEQVIAAGIRALVSKPVDTAALYSLVERLLIAQPRVGDSRSRP